MNIIELARELQVSPTTISHSLSGRGRISAATRSRVLHKAKAIGYTPNCHAQRLVTGRSNLVALDFCAEDLLTDLYSMQMARGLQHALQAYGCNLSFHVISHPEDQNTILRGWRRSRAVDGVVSLGRFLDDPEVFREVADATMPCVIITNIPIEGERHIGSVVLGIEAGIQQAVEHLAELGHREIGFVGWKDRMSGIIECEVERRGLRFHSAHDRIEPTKRRDDGAEQLHRLMARSNRPTAVLTRNDVIAMQALREAKALDLRVPQDLSIVGHDDISLPEMADPPLTSIRIDCAETARQAVELLFEMQQEESGVLDSRCVDTALAVRASTGPAPGAPVQNRTAR